MIDKTFENLVVNIAEKVFEKRNVQLNLRVTQLEDKVWFTNTSESRITKNRISSAMRTVSESVEFLNSYNTRDMNKKDKKYFLFVLRRISNAIRGV